MAYWPDTVTFLNYRPLIEIRLEVDDNKSVDWTQRRGQHNRRFSLKTESIIHANGPAMNFTEMLPVISNGPSGATLPSALSDEILVATIHDLHQYFLRLKDIDPQGNFYLAGPMCLVRKLLRDKGLQVCGEAILEFLSQYMVELEFEEMMRNDPDFRIIPATLDNIFEPERESVIGWASDLELVVDRKLAPGSDDEDFERLLGLLR